MFPYWIIFWCLGPIFIITLCYCVYRHFHQQPEIELEPGQHRMRIVITPPQIEGQNHTYQ